MLPDESGNHNNAKLANGANVVNGQGKCDSAVSPMGKCDGEPISPYKVKKNQLKSLVLLSI